MTNCRSVIKSPDIRYRHVLSATLLSPNDVTVVTVVPAKSIVRSCVYFTKKQPDSVTGIMSARFLTHRSWINIMCVIAESLC